LPTAPSWRELYQRRDYPGAAAAARSAGLSELVERLGAGELADLADAARLGGDLPAARLALQALERRFPRSVQARTAGFLIGRVLTQTGQRREAIAAFERYLALDPDGAYSLEAMGRLMELYAASGNMGSARTLAARYLARAPSGPYQRLARSLAMQR
jgi:TolA-binding protein